jgi:hypothetical protein
MPKLSLDAEFALHEFSVRYRATLAKQHEITTECMRGINNAVRDQFEQEHQAKTSQGIEAPTIEAPKIEPPQIGTPEIEGPEIKGPKIEPPQHLKQREIKGPELEP